MTGAITAAGLRKSFGGKIVLDGIDLEVGAGTTFSLLGPNGAGKTTTVQIMSAPVHADGAETIEVRGPPAHLLRRHHHPPFPTRFRHWRRRATMIINQSRPVIAAAGLRRLASAIERAGGEDTGSEGASR